VPSQLIKSLQVDLPKQVLNAETIAFEFEQLLAVLLWLVEFEQLLSHMLLALAPTPPASAKHSEIVLSQPCLHRATGSSLLLPPPHPANADAKSSAQTTGKTVLKRAEVITNLLRTNLVTRTIAVRSCFVNCYVAGCSIPGDAVLIRQRPWHNRAGSVTSARSAASIRSTSRVTLLLALTLLAWGVSSARSTARANGALPDSLGILLPGDQPQRMIAATNFGLLSSEDDGATWYWVCEDVIGMLPTLYQVGPAPEDRLLAVTVDGLSVSNDSGCSWDLAKGLTNVRDAFADPNDSLHVLAIAQAPATDGGGALQAVFESKDGGKTFGDRPKYIGPAGGAITGVEIAKSDPATIYVSMYTYSPPPVREMLVRSNDAGESWQEVHLGSTIEMLFARILAVDPTDAKKVYLRLYDNSAAEQLGIYDDARGSVKIALHVDSRMSAFLRRSDGALIVGTQQSGAFISTDGGRSFAAWPNAPHLRALGERDGSLYAVADNTMDGYAVAISDDDGASWRPLVSFAEIKGPLQCGSIPKRCEIPWQNLLATLASPTGEPPIFDMDSGADSSVRRPPATKSSAHAGCGCSVLGRSSAVQGELPIGLAVLLGGSLVRRHKARRRGRLEHRRSMEIGDPQIAVANEPSAQKARASQSRSNVAACRSHPRPKHRRVRRPTPKTTARRLRSTGPSNCRRPSARSHPASRPPRHRSGRYRPRR
jgi:photosystem II stability/assembly factor-like uncharacterized protein